MIKLWKCRIGLMPTLRNNLIMQTRATKSGRSFFVRKRSIDIEEKNTCNDSCCHADVAMRMRCSGVIQECRIWDIVIGINGALQTIGYELIILFVAMRKTVIFLYTQKLSRILNFKRNKSRQYAAISRNDGIIDGFYLLFAVFGHSKKAAVPL